MTSRHPPMGSQAGACRLRGGPPPTPGIIGTVAGAEWQPPSRGAATIEADYLNGENALLGGCTGMRHQ